MVDCVKLKRVPSDRVGVGQHRTAFQWRFLPIFNATIIPSPSGPRYELQLQLYPLADHVTALLPVARQMTPVAQAPGGL